MTATPHNGKEEDFQLFMALLDGDRFEGKFRDGVHAADVSDLMRRMVKEELLKFDGTPLFPERLPTRSPTSSPTPRRALYKEVTDYVREEFNRAEALAERQARRGTVGFALTILQRRLASSPEAIYQSLRRRRERLESRLREEELLQRGARGQRAGREPRRRSTAEDVEDLDDAPDAEVEDAEEADRRPGHGGAHDRRAGGRDRDPAAAWRRWPARSAAAARTRKWERAARELPRRTERRRCSTPTGQPRAKLVIFTEHRDTLNYLAEPITHPARAAPRRSSTIHGGMGREERRKAQEAFRHDPDVQVLLATDAAGEGINLQRAHLMVNYDLPWNPNRLEQRFGRIHRIGQTEVCHLWNLVADETREGDVYQRLLEKLEEAREALGGQVFDVLGQAQFEERPLRDLLIEAIRYGDQPEVRARLHAGRRRAPSTASTSQELLEERALAHDAHGREPGPARSARTWSGPRPGGSSRTTSSRFFLEAFERLGGTVRQREPRRYEVTHVPAPVRNRDRLIGIGEPVLPRYERIAFEKALIAPPGQPLAAFVCPGHPLLDCAVDLVREQFGRLLREGAVLVDPADAGREPRLLLRPPARHPRRPGHAERRAAGGRRGPRVRGAAAGRDASARPARRPTWTAGPPRSTSARRSPGCSTRPGWPATSSGGRGSTPRPS